MKKELLHEILSLRIYLRRKHYIEKTGTGIGRIRELMEDAGLNEPQFQYDEFFEASFLGPSYYDKNYWTYDLYKKDTVSKERLNNTKKTNTWIDKRES